MDTDACSCHAMALSLHSRAKMEVDPLQNIFAIAWTVLSRGTPESTHNEKFGIESKAGAD